MSTAPATADDHLPDPLPTRRRTGALRTTFASLSNRNFRMFATAQVFSNTGKWVQRIAQDWLVLSITGSSTDVGITTALQFVPTLLFGLSGGWIADRFAKRRVLLVTQSGMGAMAAVLAGLTLSGHIAAWHVYLVAFGLGVIITVDNPTRQSFVNELVGPTQLRNAISLNSSVFQLGALVGPAISGLLINAVGPGYAFAVNAVSYLAPIVGLALMREHEMIRPPARSAGRMSMPDVLRYIRARPLMMWTMVLLGMFAMFTNNLPVTLSSYAKTVFHSGPGGYGLLSSVVAVGSLLGCLISARRVRTSARGLIATAGAVAALYLLAAATGDEWAFVAVLAVLGAVTLVLVTSANSGIQLAAGDDIRGRVMGVYLLIFTGSGAVGGPLLGAVDQHLGARSGMLLAGVVPAAATVLVAVALARAARRPSVEPATP